jgi:hypothetical protein
MQDGEYGNQRGAGNDWEPGGCQHQQPQHHHGGEDARLDEG